MRRVDKLISIIRARTNNRKWTRDADTGIVSSGIGDDQILEYLNAAQQHLQAAIVAQFPAEFIESAIITIVAGQEEYTVPDNVFINNKIVSVEVNRNNNQTDYYSLSQGQIRDRDTRNGTPLFYIRRSGKILLNPVPSGGVGSIRVHYYRAVDFLDIRRGTIDSVTGSAPVTAITLDSSTKGLYPVELNDSEYISVVDKDGIATCNEIPVASYVGSTGVITPHTYSIPDGSSIDADNFVVIGKYSTTHSQLPDNCERYLLTYAQKRVLTKDTSESSVEEDAELRQIEADILQSYVQESRDVTHYPVDDYDIVS